MAKKRFVPDAGKYRKIDVCAKLFYTGKTVYLHSTKAYDTLAHAVIGAVLLLEKEMVQNTFCNYQEKGYFLTVQNESMCSR